ncbi:MAG: anthranilate synthase component I family protein [Pseudomonadota bacterium]
MLSLDIRWLHNTVIEHPLGSDIDCYQLFAFLKSHYSDCYYFESLALPRHQDRYFTLGFNPAFVVTARGNVLELSGDAEILQKTTSQKNTGFIRTSVDNPYHFLQRSIFTHSCRLQQGGLIGYFSHEAMNYLEPSLQLPEHGDFNAFKLGFYYDGLIYDTTTGILSYYSLYQDRVGLVKRLIAEASSYQLPTRLAKVDFIGDSVTRDQFIASANHAKEKIRQGFSFQAEVGFKSNYRIGGDKLAIYHRLRQINPSPYMFYVVFGEQELFGASPEILISAKQGRLLTTPTAGTIVRGKNKTEDMSLARQLLGNPKEIAEHNMLVDLHRNDLARVCQPGSVQVSDLMYIIQFSHVQHIVSDVVGTLRADKSAFDALAAIFPGGVVTGAPKIETIKIIAENEQVPRGPYGGAVGRFSFNGDCDFCLPIRSFFCAGENCFAQTSAGVVYDSVPEKEYREVTHKLAAMRQTLRELGER